MDMARPARPPSSAIHLKLIVAPVRIRLAWVTGDQKLNSTYYRVERSALMELDDTRRQQNALLAKIHADVTLRPTP